MTPRLSRRAFFTGAATCAACAAVGFPSGSDFRAFASAGSTAPGERLIGVHTDLPLVGLSFDDGPDPRYTPHVLALLQKRHLKATFFTIGTNALAYPDLIDQHLEAGHDLANHTYTHPDLGFMTRSAIDAEIERGTTALEQAGAPRPELFRPPRGDARGGVVALAQTDRYRTVFWTQCVERFVHEHDVRHGVARLLTEVKPGSIILAHDSGHVQGGHRPVLNRSRTMRALPLLLDGLEAQGLRAVDVATLLKNGTPRFAGD